MNEHFFILIHLLNAFGCETLVSLKRMVKCNAGKICCVLFLHNTLNVQLYVLFSQILHCIMLIALLVEECNLIHF